MNDFVIRLMKAKETSKNVRKEEAYAIAETIADILVKGIEADANNGKEEMSAKCELTQKEFDCYAQLLEFSSEEALSSLVNALHDLFEGNGKLKVEQDSSGDLSIRFTYS